MRSLRIAHIADTHLGYKYSALPNRDDDFVASWLYACRAIVDSSPDLIIHAGDVFHSYRPDWKALTAFHTGINILLEAKVPIFVIAGNHDNANVFMKHTVFTFAASILPQITATNNFVPSLHYIDKLDVNIVLMPHRSLLDKNLLTHVHKLVELMDPNSFSILVSHGSISNEDSTGELGSIAIPQAVTAYPWDYMAFGHLHLAQPYGTRGWYSGSTERCGWSDYPASPAWTLVEVSSNKSINHVQKSVPHMAMIQLPDCDCTNLSNADIYGDVLNLMDRIFIPEERSSIRVRLTNLPAARKRPIELLLRRTLLKSNPLVTISLVLDSTVSTIDALEFMSPSDRLQTVVEYFTEFVEERNYEDKDFSRRFLSIGTDLLLRDEEDTDVDASTWMKTKNQELSLQGEGSIDVES